MKKKWQTWLKISKKVVSVEATIVFGVVFIIFVTPLSYLLKMINPDVFLGSSYKKSKNTFWVKIPKKKIDLEFARKQ